MSIAYQEQPSAAVDPSDPAGLWKQRIQQAREDRRRYEPVWLSNLAFAAGKHYLMFDRFTRSMVLPPQIQTDMEQGNLYTADVITERRMRALGELSSDDDRPELLLVDDGDTQEDFADQLNKAVGYGWDYEWRGDDALLDLDQKVIDLGTAGIRCRFDPTVGKPKGEFPHLNGKPVMDADQARQLFADGPNPQVEMRPIREGRITWEVLSPFNLLVPPGVEHERDFPWEIVVRPVPLDEVKALYPAAATLTEDVDIGSIIGTDTRSDSPAREVNSALPATSSRLRDHVWVFTCYQRPNAKYPDGQVVVLAGAQMKFMDSVDELPYVGPDGERRSGISYFHWWRATGRFWSRSLVEAMKDVQRRVNKRLNQIDKTIDRGQPYVIVDKNGNAHKRRGWPMEILALEPTERQPQPVSGVQPGSWMYEDKNDAISDLDRASGIGESALGSNPENVQTYSQLALLNEQEQGKRSTIRKGRQLAIGRLVEDSVYDIRTYWGPDKQILLDSDDDRVESRVFNATKVPSFYIVRTGKGSPGPRTQAAQLQKINDIWNAAEASTAVSLDPARYLRWYSDSLAAGEPLDLPDEPNDAPTDKAKLENHLLTQGQPVEVAYYDPPQIHIPLHREAQIEADMSGDQQTVANIEIHIQQHLAMAQEVAEQQAALQPAPPANPQVGEPGGPPAPPPPPEPPAQAQ